MTGEVFGGERCSSIINLLLLWSYDYKISIGTVALCMDVRIKMRITDKYAYLFNELSSTLHVLGFLNFLNILDDNQTFLFVVMCSFFFLVKYRFSMLLTWIIFKQFAMCWDNHYMISSMVCLFLFFISFYNRWYAYC